MNAMMKCALALAVAQTLLATGASARVPGPVVLDQTEVQRACKGPTGRLVPCPKPGLPTR